VKRFHTEKKERQGKRKTEHRAQPKSSMSFRRIFERNKMCLKRGKGGGGLRRRERGLPSNRIKREERSLKGEIIWKKEISGFLWLTKKGSGRGMQGLRTRGSQKRFVKSFFRV